LEPEAQVQASQSQNFQKPNFLDAYYYYYDAWMIYLDLICVISCLYDHCYDASYACHQSENLSFATLDLCLLLQIQKNWILLDHFSWSVWK